MAKDRSYARLGAAEVDLLAAAAERLADADALLEKGRFASTIVLGLYALEITLKAKICHRLNLTHLPRPFEIHELDELLNLSGLSKRLDEPAAIRVKANWNLIVTGPALHVNDLRYLPGAHVTQAQGDLFLQQLRNLPDGILPWLIAQN
jgi:hypothetical protein